MQGIDTRKIAVTGILSALAVMAICLFRIPGPGGNVYFHLGETVIMAAAVLAGRREGAYVGAISGAVADMLLGAALWAPFSFVIHGLEGYLIGRYADGRGGGRDLAALLLGAAVMAIGYTCTVGLLYDVSLMPVELLGDTMQGGVGVLTAYPLARAVSGRMAKPRSYES